MISGQRADEQQSKFRPSNYELNSPSNELASSKNRSGGPLAISMGQKRVHKDVVKNSSSQFKYLNATKTYILSLDISSFDMAIIHF